MVTENNDKGFNRFFGTCMESLNIYASLKIKYLRGNHSSFMGNEKNNINPYRSVKRTILTLTILLCGVSKGFMKAVKAFIKLFEAPQRSAKTKIKVNFFSSFGIGTGRVKKYVSTE